MTEDAFRRACILKLRKRGGKWVVYPKTRFGAAGVSDIMGCYLGTFIAIELKRPDGKGYYKETPAQAAFLADVARNGGIAIVARSWEEIERALEFAESRATVP